ncbi:MAG TPA: hypothetical protein VKE69_02670, partial [Planctomycetota bacterium]|nr:hypothetical protein [Planctomycetota bacterium]
RGRQRWLALGPSSIGALQWRLRVCESPSARRVAAIADRSCQPTEIDAIDAIEALRAKERIASAMAILKSASLGRRWSGGSPVRLNGIARSIADPERPWVPGAPLAIAAAAAAVEATDRREPSYLDTFACAVFLAGRIDEAIATELEALGKIPPADEGALRPLLERSLARFRAATASSVASDR